MTNLEAVDGSRQAPRGRRLVVRKTMKPGAPGTRDFVRKYGEKLHRVRYLYEPATRTRFTTVELVVHSAPFHRNPKNFQPDDVVEIHLWPEDADLWRILPHTGATWDTEREVWLAPYQLAQDLGIESRVGF